MNALLSRFAISLIFRKALAVVFWIVVAIFLHRANDFSWITFQKDRLNILTFFGTLGIAVCEIVLIGVILGTVKARCIAYHGSAKKVFFAVLLVLLTLPLTATVAIVSSGFIMPGKRGAVIDSNVVAVALSSFTQLTRHLTPYEWRLAAVCVGLALAFSVGAVLLAPLYPTFRSFRIALGVAALSMAFSFYCFVIHPTYFMSAEDRQTVRAMAKHQGHPTIPLFWNKLLYAFSAEDFRRVELTLEPKYSLDEYSRSISLDTEKKNILLFMVEALRYDIIGRVENGVEVTPTLNRLVKEGRLFHRVYAQSSESAYSMVSVVTGLYPLKFEHRDVYVSVNYPYVTISDVLKAGGYRTSFFSSANERWQNMYRFTYSDSLDRFFDSESAGDRHIENTSIDTGFYLAMKSARLKTGKIDDRITTNGLISWALEAAETRKPFFSVVSYQSSHFPYQQGLAVPQLFSPCEISPKVAAQISFGWYPPEFKQLLFNRYLNSLHYIDSQIARVLEQLEQAGLADNTILLVAGDHGELFHEQGGVTHAFDLFNGVLHVPLIVWGVAPELLRDANEPSMLIDIAPTIVSLAGLPAHGNLQGRSRILDGHQKITVDKRPLYASIQNVTNQDSVIDWPWKYLRDYGRITEFLYDLSVDPSEQNNLLERQPAIAACMRKSVDNYRNSQLTYYADSKYHESSFPPQHAPVDCAPVQ